jgi:hypothetical protein
MRRSLLLLLFAACLAAPALGEGSKPAPKVPPGTSVPMPFLIAPMSKDGELLGYAYISSKLICTSQTAAIAVRQKLTFIQDANVRDVNARSVAKPDDPKSVDKEALNARLTLNAKRFVGDNKVIRIDFVQIQYAPLHPSESTLNTPLSTVDAHANGQGTAAAESAGTPANAANTAPATAATPKPAPGPAH